MCVCVYVCMCVCDVCGCNIRTHTHTHTHTHTRARSLVVATQELKAVQAELKTLDAAPPNTANPCPHVHVGDDFPFSHIHKMTGDEYFCPCCGWTGKEFNSPAWNVKSGGRQCPKCKAMERHRKSCSIMANQKSMFDPPTKTGSFRLLHFGPLPSMEKAINVLKGVDQVSVDFFAEGYTSYSDLVLNADVTNLAFPADFAHGIIILHVLEHIADPIRAMKEMRRVLHPGGWLLVEAPCGPGSEVNCSNASTDKERIERCGQYDHAWKYNCEKFKDRLSFSGFKCGRALERTKMNEKQIRSMKLRNSGQHIQYLCRIA